MFIRKSVFHLCFTFLFLQFYLYAGQEEKGVNLSPFAVLEIDLSQSFAEHDKTGSGEVGRLEAGVIASVGDKVEAGLSIQLVDQTAIELLETWFTFKPVEALSLGAGHVTMPFGEYATNLFSDPLVLGGFESDSVLIPGAETIAPGLLAGFDLHGFSAMVGVYNSSCTERLEAFGIKLGYYFKEIVAVNSSLRLEPYSKIDLDASLFFSPIRFVALIGEIYTALSDDHSDKSFFGIHTEIDIIPIEKLTIPIRFGQILDDLEEGTGCIDLAGGARFQLNDHITFGTEFKSYAKIVKGKRGGFDDLVVRISFGIE